MEAIIRLGDGKYYQSKIFGIYRNNPPAEYAYDFYYIVFDKENKKLIKKYEFNQDVHPRLELDILIIDTDKSDMLLDENGIGQVNFLTKVDIENILENKEEYQDKLELCKKYIVTQTNEYKSIDNQKDIENFLQVTGWLHDAYIKDISNTNNDLHVLFDGVWGCKIEVIFSGNISYKRRRSIETGDAWWFGCSLVMHENTIFLVDEEEFDINDNIDNYSDWFKANKMKYKVIPN